MNHNINICLLHYPVKNQNNQVINTSITNLDIHDLARLTATYQLAGLYIVQPLQKQRELFMELISFWKKERAIGYNVDRTIAFEKVHLVCSLEDCIESISIKSGRPKIISTGANVQSSMTFQQARTIATKEQILLLFGTGWGLAEEVLNNSDFILEPIQGIGSYNHLSVRSAASIIIDRICCKKWW